MASTKRKTSIPLADTGIDWSNPVGEPEVIRAAPEPEQEPPSGMMRRYLGDTAASVAKGAVMGVRMLTDTAGADNSVSTGLRTVEDFIGGLQTAEAKKDQQEIARILNEAEGKGVLDQVVAGVMAFGVAPMQTMAQAAGTSIPTIAASLIPGVGPAAVATRFAAPLALGAAQGAGAVKSSIYDEVKQRAIQEGRSPAEAEQLAVQAQEYSSANGDQIALGAGLGAWAGKSGLEGAAQRLVHGTGGKAVPGMVSRVATGAVAEGIPEAAQGGQEKYASNAAQQNAGFQTEAWSGVAAGATMEGLAGHAMGAAMGIPAPGGTPPVVDPAATPPLLPDTGPMSRAANAATIAARGQPLDFTPTEIPTKGDGLALKDEPDTTALDFEADPRFADAIAFPNGKAPKQPLFASKQIADVHIGELGAFGELEPVEAGGGQWTVQQTPEVANRNARANIEQWMSKAQPMEEAQAKDMAKRAESELNKPMTALPMPDGEGWAVVPRQWVSAPVLLDYTERAAAAAQAREAQDAAMQAVADAPVGRAPRTPRADAVEIDPAAPNAVAQFIAQQASTNTPAARAFVQDYRAGRVTDADVLARITPRTNTEPTADERLASAAKSGQVESDSTPAGLILNREGQPFKTQMAAAREQKKHAGSEVVAVPGGHAVQPSTVENTDAQVEQAAAVPEAVAQSAVQEGIDSGSAATPATSEPGSAGAAAGAGGALEANGLTGKPKKLPFASKEDTDHLFGVDKRRQTALERIAAGKAWFSDGAKAKDFITKSGLSDTHKAAQGKGGRWDVVANGEQAASEPAIDRRNRLKAERAEGWTAFTSESGTLGIPRAEMPQIKAEHRGAMVNFLAARGITHETGEVVAGDLKPTQTEYSTAKVEKAKTHEGGDRSILVSSDGHVLDGHHQWLAKSGAEEKVKVIRLDAPIKKLLAEVAEFPSAETSNGATAAEVPVALQPNSPTAEPQGNADKPEPAKPEAAPGEATAVESDAPTARPADDAQATKDSLASDVPPSAPAAAEAAADSVSEKIDADAPSSVAAEPVMAKESKPADPMDDTKKPDRLTDAGEELIRNRRGKLKGLAWDDVSAMNDTLKVAQVIKSNVWPRPDYAKMVEAGSPAWKAAALKAIYDKIAAAPVTTVTPTDADLKAYIETVQAVRDALAAELERVDAPGDANDPWKMLKAANVFGKVFPTPADAKPMFGAPSPFDRTSEQGKDNNRRALLIGGNNATRALQFGHATTSKVADLLKDGFPAKMQAWQKSYEVRQQETRDNDVPEAERNGEPQQRFYVYEKGSRWRLAKGGQDGGYATQEGAEAFARSLVAKKKEVLPPSRGLDLAEATRTGPDWRGGRDVAAKDLMDEFGFRGVNLGEYVKAKQDLAQLHLNHAFDAFRDLADLLGVPPKAMSLDGTLGIAIGAQGSGKALAHFVPGVNEINITRDSGAGALAHEFGHAMDHYFATQHGRATSMAKRPYLSAVVEGLKDAGGVRPEVVDAMRAVMAAINTRKMTPLEARKYIADQRALNQRRLDRWVEEFKGNKGADKAALTAVAEKLKLGELGASQDSDVETNLAEFMRAAGLKPGNAIAANAFAVAYRLRDLADEVRFIASHIPQRASDYANVSAAMDAKKPGEGYWGTPWEMFARAFETFAMDALRDRQRESLYLSGLVDSKGWRNWASETGKSIPYPAGDERLVMQQAFQKLVDTIETREDEAGNVAMFSRSKASPEENALRALSENDDLFQRPKSDKDTVEGITADNDPNITVGKNTAIPGEVRYNFKLPSGKTARMMVRNPNPYGGNTYGFDYADGDLSNVLNERPGDNPEDVDPDKGDVWIDVSLLESGEEGRAIYNIAATYAYNTSRIFIGDPAGLSDDAMRRRPEQMLSSALKFGTTEHLAPHPRQISGDKRLGIPPLKWVYGDDLGNIQRLIDLNLKALDNAGLDAITYDPQSGNFLDSQNQPLSRADIAELAASGYGRGALAGGRTLSRGSILNAISSKRGEAGDRDGDDGAGLLGRLLRQSAVHPQATHKLFYSRSKPGQQGLENAPSDVARVEALVALVKARWKNAPDVVVVESLDDPRVPQAVRDEGKTQQSQGALGIPEGFFHGGKVYLVAPQLGGDADVVRVLFHEALGHFGLRGTFGAELGAILDRLAVLNAGKVRAKAKQYGLDYDKTSDRRIAAEEVLAEMAQRSPDIGWAKKAVAAIRTWLREHVPGFRKMALSDAEIVRSFLLPARAFVQRGGAGGVSFSRAKADAEDAGGRPAFSRAAAAPGEPRSDPRNMAEVAKKAGRTLADYRGVLLQSLGRRQLVDLYSGDIPALTRYSDLVQQMEADKNEAGAEADNIANRWAKLPDEQKLSELMHDATLAQIDPAKDLAKGDDAAEHRRLANRFKALSPEAQKLYADAREMYAGHWGKVHDAIVDRIQRTIPASAKRAEMLQQMDLEFVSRVKGVYFPLARFGDYAVVVKHATGVVISVTRAETLNEAEAARVEALKQFKDQPDVVVGKVLKSKEFNATRDTVSKGFIKDLFDTLEGQGVPDDVFDSINQLYLESLPDLSWNKHGIHRKGTPGFSQNARRAFAQHMFHGARNLAKLRYSDQLADGLTEMQEQVQAKDKDEAFDSVRAQQVVDEMVKRHDTLMNPKTNALSTMLTSVGFVFHLGLSPASAMVNLSQTALVSYPMMGAKWGFTESAAALLSASKLVASNKNDLSAVLAGDEKLAFDEAVRNGTIDVTQAHDLAGIAQGEDSKVSWKIRPVMRWASYLFHHAEKFNRQATFLASYRLAKDKGGTHQEAFDQATRMTYDSHFDYGAANRPRIMQGNVAKVVLLFKQFGQNMIYTLARQAQLTLKGATPEQRSEARKALAGLLVMHAAGAGALGLPLVTTLLAVASMIGGSDDEPWDAQVALRNMLADTFGAKAGEVMAHGLSRLTPWDVSGRVGLDHLILPDVQEGLEGQRLGEAMSAAALGPVAGIGMNVLKGLQTMADGQFARGLEEMMPSVVRGPMRALRFGSEGAVDKSGVAIKDEVSPLAIAGQVLGLSPSEVREATEAKSAIKRADGMLMKRRSTLLASYSLATMAGDTEGQAEARQDIDRFNKANPQRSINRVQMAQSVRARRKRIEQAQQGVYLPAKRRDAMEAGRFATGS